MIIKILPQIIYFALIMISLGMSMVNHGKPREGKENFFIHLAAIIMAAAILYWGGFFDVLLGK